MEEPALAKAKRLSRFRLVLVVAGGAGFPVPAESECCEARG